MWLKKYYGLVNWTETMLRSITSCESQSCDVKPNKEVWKLETFF